MPPRYFINCSRNQEFIHVWHKHLEVCASRLFTELLAETQSSPFVVMIAPNWGHRRICSKTYARGSDMISLPPPASNQRSYPEKSLQPG